MSLAPGTKLHEFEIVDSLGVGGMGEVYRARDTKLGREVAIKVLPEELSQDRERLTRFEREAKLLAALNHPAVAHLYGFEEADGTTFLIMELVEGETLAERIARGPIPIDEAISLFIQIAEGLEAAHEKGIIHRDLKPANIKITPDGHIKILDFGLAKAFLSDEDVSAETSQSPTLTKGTALGAIMGTVAYMSPEQAKGHAVDKRTDVWAFGCCLYEALTAQRPFPGDNVAETLARVIEREPDWSVLPSEIPSGMERLLRRCLRKKRGDRLRDIGDARLELSEAGAIPVEARAPARGRSVAYRAALGAAAVAALATWLLMSGGSADRAPAPVHRATIVLPEGQSQRRLWSAPFAISRDGSLLAYAAEDSEGSSLFLRALDSFETRRLGGTEGADMPFFSPDGEWVGFFAAGKLKKVSVERGSTLTIANAPQGWGASWGEDDTILFAPSLSGGLFQVSADGGTPENLTTPDFGEAGYAHVWPQHLPGGREAMFSVFESPPLHFGVVRLDSGEREIVSTGRGAQYLTTGHLLYSNPNVGRGLLASAFDARRSNRIGPSVQVADDVRLQFATIGRPYVSVSDTGTMVYVEERTQSATLAWMDRAGTLTTILTRTDLGSPRISPNGRRIVFVDEKRNMGVLDIARGTTDIIVSSASMSSTRAQWHPDGQRIVFQSNVSGDWDLYEVTIPPRGEPERLLERLYPQQATSWSPDGRFIAYAELHPDTGYDLWVLPVGAEPVPVLVTEFNESNAFFSRDGRFLAYVSDVSGRREVYVRSFPEGEVTTISSDGGESPIWSRDGDEIFYRRGNAFMAVRVTTSPEFRAAAPELLHEQRFDWGVGLAPALYDVAPGDERFVVVADRATTELKVVFNWFNELERLMSTEN